MTFLAEQQEVEKHGRDDSIEQFSTKLHIFFIMQFWKNMSEGVVY